MKILKSYQTTKKESKRRRKEQKRTTKHAENNKQNAISIKVSIITLTINGINSLIKRHKINEWIKKNKTHLYAVCKR